MQVEENFALASHTTFSIGGPARFFVSVKTIDELQQALAFAKDKQLRILVLGGGSNMLIDDAGFDGLVIKIEISGITVQDKEGAGPHTNQVGVGAGESWDALVARTVNENLWGIENLSGIPGTVGGAVAGNIGAYGQALSQTLYEVEVFDTQTSDIKKMSNNECRFGYRESIFSSQNTASLGYVQNRYVLLRATFVLSRESKPELSYKDLKDTFGGEKTPDIQAIRDATLAIRRGKFPDVSIEGTAGSFFKNPILLQGEVEKLALTYPGLPLFPMPETPGKTKVAIAWLLDHVLHMHGTEVGTARLFEKQILVVVARRHASARDVRTLTEEVAKKVFDTFGITLEPEVKIIS